MARGVPKDDGIGMFGSDRFYTDVREAWRREEAAAVNRSFLQGDTRPADPVAYREDVEAAAVQALLTAERHLNRCKYQESAAASAFVQACVALLPHLRGRPGDRGTL